MNFLHKLPASVGTLFDLSDFDTAIHLDVIGKAADALGHAAVSEPAVKLWADLKAAAFDVAEHRYFAATCLVLSDMSGAFAVAEQVRTNLQNILASGAAPVPAPAVDSAPEAPAVVVEQPAPVVDPAPASAPDPALSHPAMQPTPAPAPVDGSGAVS